jgi:hypothetical protein
LTNKNESDTLIVETPIKIEGFITKSHTLNPREIFRGQLKDIINEKKLITFKTQKFLKSRSRIL